jgi:hypothetical protein
VFHYISLSPVFMNIIDISILIRFFTCCQTKAQPGHDADHSPPSSAEVKKELYLLSPKAPPWHVTGPLYLFFYFYLLPKVFSVNL